MQIRDARAADFPLLEAMPHAMHYEHHLAFLRHAAAHRNCLVAEDDGAIIGYAVWDRGFYARPFLWMLGVLPERRGGGLGSKLIQRVEELNAGLVLYTSTNESNVPMQRLLEHRGFSPAGRLENLDPGDPEIFYCKPL